MRRRLSIAALALLCAPAFAGQSTTVARAIPAPGTTVATGEISTASADPSVQEAARYRLTRLENGRVITAGEIAATAVGHGIFEVIGFDGQGQRLTLSAHLIRAGNAVHIRYAEATPLRKKEGNQTLAFEQTLRLQSGQSVQLHAPQRTDNPGVIVTLSRL